MAGNGRISTGRNFPVYEKPAPACLILARELGVTVEEARQALVALVSGGYGIAPRNPTNGMLVGYLEALTPPKGHEQVITAIGKARVRWQAMLEHGTAMALSTRLVTPISSCDEHDVMECDDTTVTRDSGSDPQGGDAKLAPCEASQSGGEAASPEHGR